jgi:hypothetical protein
MCPATRSRYQPRGLTACRITGEHVHAHRKYYVATRSLLPNCSRHQQKFTERVKSEFANVPNVEVRVHDEGKSAPNLMIINLTTNGCFHRMGGGERNGAYFSHHLYEAVIKLVSLQT